MTGFQDAVNWFYHWQKSEIIGTDLEQRLLKVFNPSLSQTDRANLVAELITETKDTASYVELLVQIGLRYRGLGFSEVALANISLAIDGYAKQEDIHHLSCLRWMYGWLLWEVGRNLDACRQWRMAIDAWVKLSPVLKYRLDVLDSEIPNARMASLRYVDREEWHRKQIEHPGGDAKQHEAYIANYQAKINQWQAKFSELTIKRQGILYKDEWYRNRIHEMRIFLLCNPEEAYLLMKDLSKMEPDRLDKGFIAQREGVERLIADKKTNQLVNKVEQMIAEATIRTPVEKAESYLVSAWAIYRVGGERWEQYLKKAIFLYPPDSLARVWSRWLSGAIDWGISTKRGGAAEQWTIAVQDITRLKERAEWQNNPKLVNDLMDISTVMQGALDLQRNNLA